MSLNYNFNRKEISSAEISAKMDFREVLSNYKIVTKPFYKTGWFASTVTVTAVAAITLVMLNQNPEENKSTQNPVTDENTITYKEDSPCIKPPIKEADVPFTSYMIKNEEGGKIVHHSGSEINLPAGIFTVDGKPVVGDVEIRYREFRDPADFILSGIPMTYDSAGTKYHFESAGMLEIRAFQDGKEVQINKEIEVNFASDYGDTKYNFYKLDESKDNWVCLGKDKVSETKNSDPNNNSTSDKGKLIAFKDEELKEVKKEIAILKVQKPMAPIKWNKNNYSFKLDILEEEFPELAALSVNRFEVSPDETKFSQKIFDTDWEDVKLERDAKNEQLYIVLSKGTRKNKYAVYPVFEGKDYTDKKAKFDSELKTYSAKLDSRLAEEKKLETELADLRADKVQKNKELVKKNNELKNSTTSVLSPGDHEGFQKNVISQKDKNIRAVGSFITFGQYKYDRKLKLPSLGVFNCDHAVASLPIREKGKKHRFQFQNKDGVSLIMSLIYVIEKKRNVLFTYTPEEFESIRMSGDQENSIIGITTTGEIAVALPLDLNVLDWKSQVLDIQMRVFEKLKDATDLKMILNPES